MNGIRAILRWPDGAFSSDHLTLLLPLDMDGRADRSAFFDVGLSGYARNQSFAREPRKLLKPVKAKLKITLCLPTLKPLRANPPRLIS